MIQIAVSYTDRETLYFPVPVDQGWRFDSATRALVIGRGIGRTHVPLDNVRSFSVETTDAPDETAPEPSETERAARLADAVRTIQSVPTILPPELKGPTRWMSPSFADSMRKVPDETAPEPVADPRDTEPTDWAELLGDRQADGSVLLSPEAAQVVASRQAPEPERAQPDTIPPWALVVVAGEPQEDGSVLFPREAVKSMADAMSQGAGEIARLGDELEAARAQNRALNRELDDTRLSLVSSRNTHRDQATVIRNTRQTVRELRDQLAGKTTALANAERELGDVKADRETRRRHGDLPFGHKPGCPRIRWSPEAAGGWLYNQHHACTCNQARVHDVERAWDLAIREKAKRDWDAFS